MRKLSLIAPLLLVVGSAWGAVVILKGGKQLEVVSFEQKGNYLVVVQADGKRVSFPLAAVDLDATKKANAQPEAPPEAKPSEAPKSPFAAAVAKPGKPAAVVTDADVQKVAPVGEAPEEGKQQTPAEPTGGNGVVVVGWSGREAGEGKWEVVANLVNQAKEPVQNVAVSVRAMGEGGAELGTGSASYPGTVQPGQQFTVPVTIASPLPPKQVIFSLNWQQLKPVPETPPPAPKATPAPQQPSAAGGS
jgi:hypothetical protein